MRAVRFEFRKPRTGIDQHIVRDLMCCGVDKVRHVCRFRRIDDHLAVRADAHAFRLNADRNFGEDLFGFQVNDRHQIVIFIGDVKRLAIWRKFEKLRVRA